MSISFYPDISLEFMSEGVLKGVFRGKDRPPILRFIDHTLFEKTPTCQQGQTSATTRVAVRDFATREEWMRYLQKRKEVSTWIIVDKLFSTTLYLDRDRAGALSSLASFDALEKERIKRWGFEPFGIKNLANCEQTRYFIQVSPSLSARATQAFSLLHTREKTPVLREITRKEVEEITSTLQEEKPLFPTKWKAVLFGSLLLADLFAGGALARGMISRRGLGEEGFSLAAPILREKVSYPITAFPQLAVDVSIGLGVGLATSNARSSLSCVERVSRWASSLLFSKMGGIVYLSSFLPLGAANRTALFSDEEETFHTKSLQIAQHVASLKAAGQLQEAKLEAKALVEFLYGLHGKDSVHPDLIAALATLSTLCSEVGDFTSALQYAEEALHKEQQKAETAITHNLAAVLNNIGLIYKRMGNLKEAEYYFENALYFHNKLQKLRPHRTAEEIAAALLHKVACLNNLANIYQDKGELMAAEAKLEESLAIIETLSQQSPSGLSLEENFTQIWNSLANIYLERGEIEKAMVYLTQAVSVLRKMRSDAPYAGTATLLMNLSVLHRRQGNLEEAFSYQEEAISITHRLYGDKPHPTKAVDAINKALLLKEMQRPEEALQSLDYAIDILENLDGGYLRKEIMRAWNNKGKIYKELGQQQKAVACFHKGLELSKVIFGEAPNLEKVFILINLSTIETEKEEAYLHEAYAVGKQLFPEEPHFSLREILSRLIQVRQKENDYLGTIAYREELILLKKKLYKGQAHEDLIQEIKYLALLYWEFSQIPMGEGKDPAAQEKFLPLAESLSREGLSFCKALYHNEPHLETAIFTHNLALILLEQERLEESVKYIEEALSMEEVFGSDPLQRAVFFEDGSRIYWRIYLRGRYTSLSFVLEQVESYMKKALTAYRALDAKQYEQKIASFNRNLKHIAQIRRAAKS